MKPSELRQALTQMIVNKVPVTPFIWSQHGVGKSSIVRQVAKELGYHVIHILLSQKEATDLTGIPYVFEDASTGNKVTCNFAPDWFNHACKVGKTVIFFDEFNMARRETMGAAFEPVLDRRLNNRYLPDDVFLVAAGNPEDERYDVTPMSESLMDRFVHIHLQPESSEWVAWARENGVHEDLISFIQMNPSSLYHKDDKDSKSPFKIKHSARSMERASTLWKLSVPQDTKQELLIGTIGLENTMAFIKSLEANAAKPLSLEECQDIAKVTRAFSKWKEKRMDLITASMENFIPYTQTKEHDVEVTKQFILALPEDLSCRMLKEYCSEKNTNNKASELFVTPEIQELAKQIAKAKTAAKEKTNSKE